MIQSSKISTLETENLRQSGFIDSRVISLLTKFLFSSFSLTMPNKSTASSNRFASTHAKLLKKANRFKSDDPMSLLIVQKAISILEYYKESPGHEGNIIYEAEDVRNDLVDELPTSLKIFTDEFFHLPTTPMVLLYEIATLYGFAYIDPSDTRLAQISKTDLEDRKIIVLTWFAFLLDCDPNLVKGLVDRFKNSRGSVNLRFTENNIQSDKSLCQDRENIHDVEKKSNYQTEITANNNINDSKNDEFKETVINHPKATNIYTGNSEENKNTFIDENGKRYLGLSNSNTNYNSHTEEKLDTNASKISSIMSTKKFTGELTQSIEKTITYFEIVSKQYHLSDGLMVDYFIYALGGPAETFFLNNRNDEMTYKEIKKLLLKEYNSDARQIQVKGKLDVIRLSNVMTEYCIKDLSTGLRKLVSLIEDLVPQCHPDFRTESHKIH